MPNDIQNEGIQIKMMARRFLIDNLLSMGNISGKKDLVEYLNLIWPLNDMPSTDYRFNTAYGDIWQHMVNNSDWDWDYLFGQYLNLFSGLDEQFFRFLENTVHPLVRTSITEQQQYVEVINQHLKKDGFKLEVREEIIGYNIYRVIKIGSGVKGAVKNLIFAANGPKPDIVLSDSINNDIEIRKNAEYCLIYDLPIPETGLLWSDMVAWWVTKQGKTSPTIETERELYMRLKESLDKDSPPERLFYETYFKCFKNKLGNKLPCLIPQVYLHYDPYTIRERKLHKSSIFTHQRMDFLMLFSNHQRVVIEIDGKQHYSVDGKANPEKYAEMVAADRQLKLLGYEVYRFGGSEITPENGATVVENFFIKLFKKYNITNFD